MEWYLSCVFVLYIVASSRFSATSGQCPSEISSVVLHVEVDNYNTPLVCDSTDAMSASSLSWFTTSIDHGCSPLVSHIGCQQGDYCELSAGGDPTRGVELAMVDYCCGDGGGGGGGGDVLFKCFTVSVCTMVESVHLAGREVEGEIAVHEGSVVVLEVIVIADPPPSAINLSARFDQYVLDVTEVAPTVLSANNRLLYSYSFTAPAVTEEEDPNNKVHFFLRYSSDQGCSNIAVVEQFITVTAASSTAPSSPPPTSLQASPTPPTSLQASPTRTLTTSLTSELLFLSTNQPTDGLSSRGLSAEEKVFIAVPCAVVVAAFIVFVVMCVVAVYLKGYLVFQPSWWRETEWKTKKHRDQNSLKTTSHITFLDHNSVVQESPVDSVHSFSALLPQASTTLTSSGPQSCDATPDSTHSPSFSVAYHHPGRPEDSI